MKHIPTLTLMLMLSMAGIAQTHTLSGTVCDEQGTLPYATVMVWQGNDTVKATYGIQQARRLRPARPQRRPIQRLAEVHRL